MGESFWQKESLLHTIHYDSAPRPLRYCFANPNVHPSWPSQANDFEHVLAKSVFLRFFLLFPDAVSGWAEWVLAYPVFGSSVNPIPTRWDKLCPPHYCLPTRIWKLNDISALSATWRTFVNLQSKVRSRILKFNIFQVFIHYGNTGCGVFK